MAQSSEIELQSRVPAPEAGVGNLQAGEGRNSESGLRGHEFSLPPVDRGKAAWLFLAAAVAVEALVWGFPFAFGVFQDHYSSHAPFAGSTNIAVIGTCAMGIMYLSAPLVFAFSLRFPRWVRWMPMAGLLIMCISLAMSAFSTTVTQLIATQGILYGVGGSICYCPCIVYMDEWFMKRKGLAYGIMWSGTGIAGVVVPLLVERLLSQYGYKTTLRLWASLLFVTTAPLAYFLKPRVPVSTNRQARPFNSQFLLSTPFLLHQFANVIEAMGYFLPGIYLPSYARNVLGVSGTPSAVTILLSNVASVFGCIAMGALVDRFHVTTCILVSTIGATTGIFLLWGLSSNLPVLYIFSIVYGLFAGSFTTVWPGIMKEVVRKAEAEGQGAIDPTMVFGWLAAGRGVGNVVSGPLSELLVKDMPWQGAASAGYGSGYGGLIVFTGVTAFVGGASFAFRRVGLL